MFLSDAFPSLSSVLSFILCSMWDHWRKALLPKGSREWGPDPKIVGDGDEGIYVQHKLPRPRLPHSSPDLPTLTSRKRTKGSADQTTQHTINIHLHYHCIISIYVENKFPFGNPARLYWHLVDPLIFKFLHLQRFTSESFLRLKTECSCTWEFPLWPENLKWGMLHA